MHLKKECRQYFEHHRKLTGLGWSDWTMYQKLKTSYGDIAYIDTHIGEQTIIFVHGNSSCKEVFEKQFNSDLADRFRLIAFDLPGHGNSARADSPVCVYTIFHYAQLLAEISEKLSVVQPLLVGWSLGGHVVFEAAAQGLDAMGLLITGTPPFGPGVENIASAFHSNEHMALASKAQFTVRDAENYAKGTVGAEELLTDHLLSQVRNCDGRARHTMFSDWTEQKNGHSAVAFIATWERPIAVVHGELDAFVKVDYLRALNWKNLWTGEVVMLPSTGHAPFLQRPEIFNCLLLEFVEECSMSGLSKQRLLI